MSWLITLLLLIEALKKNEPWWQEKAATWVWKTFGTTVHGGLLKEKAQRNQLSSTDLVLLHCLRVPLAQEAVEVRLAFSQKLSNHCCHLDNVGSFPEWAPQTQLQIHEGLIFFGGLLQVLCPNDTAGLIQLEPIGLEVRQEIGVLIIFFPHATKQGQKTGHPGPALDVAKAESLQGFRALCLRPWRLHFRHLGWQSRRLANQQDLRTCHKPVLQEHANQLHGMLSTRRRLQWDTLLETKGSNVHGNGRSLGHLVFWHRWDRRTLLIQRVVSLREELPKPLRKLLLLFWAIEHFSQVSCRARIFWQQGSHLVVPSLGKYIAVISLTWIYIHRIFHGYEILSHGWHKPVDRTVFLESDDQNVCGQDEIEDNPSQTWTKWKLKDTLCSAQRLLL